MHRLLPCCLVPLLAGCCTACPRPDPYRAASPPAPNASAVAFVADGSGDARTVSVSLAQLAAEAGVPLQVEPVVWSLGYRRVVADHVDHANHVAQGRLLAGRYGFTPVVACPSDVALYGGLRQHTWSPAVAWTGHDGGHYGSVQAGFLRAYVLTLLACD